MDESKRDEKEEESNHLPKQLDAGALFVLKSRGSWLHCGYHLTTSIVAPALLSLPLALSLLGWFAGVVCLTVAAMVTFYSYNLLSLVLDHHAHLGHRQLRFRDMATDVLGPGWGKYFVGPIQFGLCYGAVIACTLLGGQSLKNIYMLSSTSRGMQLYQFVIIFGVLKLVLAQIPSFHNLRHINLASLILCLAYSACATAGSIYIGNSKMAPPKDYSVNGSGSNRIFGSLNAISIIATTYGNGIIPEIQATIAAPVKGKMLKGLLVCYGVVITTFFSVGISGYWAFGNQAKGTILQNFMVDDHHKPLLPNWVLLMTNVFTLLQVAAVSVVYLQPTNEALEKKFSDATIEQFSLRNVIPRKIQGWAPFRDYSMNGSQLNKVFGAFNGISIISTTFASGIIPEIQATIAAPVKGKMFKGLCMCYGVIICTFFSVAISGYWAFGNQSKGTILYNFMGDEKPLLPTWFLLMTNIFTLMQLIAITLIYLQPTNELFEKWFANPKMDQFSTRNILPQLIFWSLSVITATTLATMLPFFGDIIALFGAFGCIPLDFILPMVFYNVTFKPSKQSIVFWGNTLIALVSSGLVAVGAVASVRQIILDAKTYSLFANV
ncbi:hypothetical protein LWI29_028463 [Acer saccharum]|uniref:Amino acid transporter transmembrane domain-containing protein n=1 Tax=Acer saccharum TaxID=4024 RepID=A0AA39VWC6_ACESA|nr:hypothetical protein LWI29_028463 [Acer saccharum]